MKRWAVVVAQLVEQLLPSPKVRFSNPVIGKIYIECLLVNVGFEKTKIKGKMRLGMPQLKNSISITRSTHQENHVFDIHKLFSSPSVAEHGSKISVSFFKFDHTS